MDTVRSLLVHADPLVRARLRRMLAHAPGVSVLGEAAGGFEALELLAAIPYATVFCGFSLAAEPAGELTGEEFARMLPSRLPAEHVPALVFVAADQRLAYKAFELDAADYLVCPPQPLDADTDDNAKSDAEPDIERLRKMAAKLRRLAGERRDILAEPDYRAESVEERTAHMTADARLETVRLPLDEDNQAEFLSALSRAWDAGTRKPGIEKLAITMEGRVILIPFDEVIFVEADEDYSYVHTAAQKYITSYRLKNLEDRLVPHGFFRVHRKYLVNLEMVTEIGSLPGSNFMLRTAGKKRIELPVSRRRVAELKEILGL